MKTRIDEICFAPSPKNSLSLFGSICCTKKKQATAVKTIETQFLYLMLFALELL
jgi:hypothetical protein